MKYVNVGSREFLVIEEYMIPVDSIIKIDTDHSVDRKFGRVAVKIFTTNSDNDLMFEDDVARDLKQFLIGE